MKRRRLTVLVSGTGRNLHALLDFRNHHQRRWEVVQVISNKPGVRALEIAQQAGIPATVVDHRQYAQRSDFDAALAMAIEGVACDGVILACTELSLLVNAETIGAAGAGLHIFDSASIHAQAAANFMLGIDDVDQVGGGASSSTTALKKG